MLDLIDDIKTLSTLELQIEQHHIELLLSQYALHILQGTGYGTQIDPRIFLQLASNHTLGVCITFHQNDLNRTIYPANIASHEQIPQK